MDANLSTADIGLVQDVHNLDKLRKMGKGDYESKKQALFTAAEQFESLLNQFWFKGMRESNDSICPDSPLRSSDSGIFQSMLDEQLITGVAKANSANSSSLTKMLVRQFAKSMGDDGKKIVEEMDGKVSKTDAIHEVPNRQNFDSSTTSTPSDSLISILNQNQVKPSSRSGNYSRDNSRLDAYASVNDNRYDNDLSFKDQKDFVSKLMPLARKVAKPFNLNPIVIVCQAALETGWGKHVGADNNYFGIKGGSSWKGETAMMESPEFENGKMVKQVSSFRVYNSPRKSFEDYVGLIVGNQRYAKAASVSSDPDQYFEEIQRAGYATDPNYARKLKSILRNDAFKSYINE